VLQAFYPPPFNTPDQERLNLLCPVRALDAYVHRAALWRNFEQLFVCFGSLKKESPASKQVMSKWIVEAISLAYEAAEQLSPMAVRAHSTRSMAASTAFILSVSLLDFYNAAGCPLCIHFSDFMTLASPLLGLGCLLLSVRKDFTQNGHFSAWRSGYGVVLFLAACFNFRFSLVFVSS